MVINVERSKDRAKLYQKKATKSIDVLFILQVASFHVLLAIEQPDCLIEEVLLVVAFWHPYKQLRHKPAKGKLHVYVAIEERGVLGSNESEHFD